VTKFDELLLTNIGRRVRVTNELTDEAFEGTLDLDPAYVGKLIVRDDEDNDIIPLFHDDEIELL